MTMHESKIEDFGLIQLPRFAGHRIMMMPFLMEEPVNSLPEMLGGWRLTVAIICARSSVKSGVGYLTIDEAFVRKGETHRRPGLHVDGPGTYGGGGGYAKNGMFLAASHFGCIGVNGTFTEEPGLDGSCEHFEKIPFFTDYFLGQHLYWCSPFALHKAVPMWQDTHRQFIRVSMPSDAQHHREYTPNPTGVQPTGEPAPARTEHMSFRA